MHTEGVRERERKRGDRQRCRSGYEQNACSRSLVNSYIIGQDSRKSLTIILFSDSNQIESYKRPNISASDKKRKTKTENLNKYKKFNITMI